MTTLLKFPEASSFRIPRFLPRIELELRDSGERYLVRTARDRADLLRIFALRHRAFFGGDGLDQDAFDPWADHLMVIDRDTGELLGTYRLICDLFAPRFYSSTEFHLGSLPHLSGVTLELGRACVAPHARGGACLSLLWRGLAAYSAAVGATRLIGCSSAMTLNPGQIEGLVQALPESVRVPGNWGTRPREEFSRERLRPSILHERPRMGGDEIPSLLRSYLLAGARVCAEPALDLEMGCADWLTVLDLEWMTPLFRRRYGFR